MEGAEKHWGWWLLLFWLLAAALLTYYRWGVIQGFSLGDTDDNMRMMQVRALLEGQGWYDLRQHRLNPPYGADIHWSRLVDLPIAGIKLMLAPILGGAPAEKVAVAVAPLLPMAVALVSIAVTMRRLIEPKAFALGAAILFCAHAAMGMWAPLRIDHHGWQLAMLSLVIAFFGLYYLLLYPRKIWLSVRDFLPFSDHATETLRDRGGPPSARFRGRSSPG